ncbi:restriction endonuclease subunit S, partial [Pseudomonas putida]|uniref:restriction endonuclease subunit S n=1 Tax=Pseudomonas putida TaxID=303 RepID=UPI000AA50701
MGSGSYVSIGELESLGAITAIQDGNHGNYHPKASEYTGSGIPFVMASDIKDGRIDLKGCSRLPKERTDRLRIGFAKSGDVLLTHKGTVGSVALAPNVPDYLMLTPQVTYYRTASDQLLPAYLAYAFREPGFQQQMISESAQSTRPYIGIQAQRRLRVRYVDIKNQHRIVSILSAYDDLIENNTRRIEILEEMARRLYEEWFVQFRFPGHEGVEFKESELGMIPEGWKVSALDEFGEIITGKTPSKNKSEFFGGDVPFIKLPDMHGNTFIIETTEKLSQEGMSSQKTKTIPPGSICVSCIGTAGVVVITSEPSQTNQQINSIVPRAPELREFLFFAAT